MHGRGHIVNRTKSVDRNIKMGAAKRRYAEFNHHCGALRPFYVCYKNITMLVRLLQVRSSKWIHGEHDPKSLSS